MASLPDGVLTKRLLVDVSHAIERYALAAEHASEPTLVIAMFQRLSYFMREVEVYRRIADSGAVTVVGIAEDYPPALPAGISHVLLDPGEPLAHEWSVTVLSPSGGATLVATDLETVTDAAATLEAGRQFDGGWSFLREHAYVEALRLRDEFEGRLDPAILHEVEDVLRTTAARPGRREEDRTNASMHLLTRRLARELTTGARLRHQLETGPAATDRDSRSGLRTDAFLDRWMRNSATGTLPLGLLLLRVPDLRAVRRDLGVRAELAAARLVGDRLSGHLRGPDRAVVLGDTDFLMLLPSRGTAEIASIHRNLLHDLDDVEWRYPYVPLHASAVATVTRERPLPLPDLVRAVSASEQDELALVPC
jgi:DICT domain-containing protein/GGDEF domain-containing protein